MTTRKGVGFVTSARRTQGMMLLSESGYAGKESRSAAWGTIMTRSETPNLGIVDEAVRRILVVSKPRRVILFGSAARGEMGPDSDLDMLVIVPEGTHRRRTAQPYTETLRGWGWPRILWWLPKVTYRSTAQIHL